MDIGYGACVFRDPTLASETSKSLLHFQGQRYLISCFVVMPNHVHLTMKPLAGYDLERILDGIKGSMSRKVNRFLRRTGKLWEQESYDRIVRDEEHLFRVIQSIGRNAATAGLPRTQWVRWLHPAEEQADWVFRDDE